MQERWMDLPEQKDKIKPTGVPHWFLYGTLGIFLMLLSALAVIAVKSTSFSANSSGMISQWQSGPIRLDTQTSRFILRKTLPALDRSAGEDDPFTLLEFNWSEIYWRLAVNIKSASPQEILKAQLPLLALIKPKPLPPVRIIQHPVPKPDMTPPVKEFPPLLNEAPLVFIYHSHTTESYLPESGKDHTPNQKGDIVKVGSYLQKILEEKYGIRCIHNEDIHDTFPFRDSYKRSQITVMKYLKEYPSFKVVLDIHRDATPGIDATAIVKGQETATIAIVVGSDKMGLEHPNWRKNHQFATELADAMNHYYPGLCSKVILSDARYNQHLHDHSLIIEFGDQNSTIEKVYRAADRFAEILVSVMDQEATQANPGQ